MFVRVALILLALDLGAVWACLVILCALRRDRLAPPAPPARALTRDQPAPGERRRPRPVPLAPPADPWEAVEAFRPTLPAWTGPTDSLPRLEVRRVIRCRNDPPAAAEPPPGRYVELLITRR